jgi:hypothetical protein
MPRDGRSNEVGRGRMERPEAVVLPDASLVPLANVASPPTTLTHEVAQATPFHFTEAADGAPAGTLAAGTRVAVGGRGDGRHCRVVRGDGLTVYVPCSSLRPV